MARGNLRRDGTNPIVVVTGGNRGIGFGICRQLAARGAQVVLTARKPAAGAAAVKKLAAQKLAVEFQTLDVTDGDSIAALRDFLQNAFGRLDVLINNAGIIPKGEAPALKVGLPTIRATLETNTLGPLQLAQALVPLLRRGTSPRIVNLSSGMARWRTMTAVTPPIASQKRRSTPSAQFSRQNCAARSPSTRCARAGCGPIWAARMPAATLLTGRAPPSGSRSTRRKSSPASSCATAKSFRGEREVRRPMALNGAAAQD